jgi:hypothetical protein
MRTGHLPFKEGLYPILCRILVTRDEYDDPGFSMTTSLSFTIWKKSYIDCIPAGAPVIIKRFTGNFGLSKKHKLYEPT